MKRKNGISQPHLIKIILLLLLLSLFITQTVPAATAEKNQTTSDNHGEAFGEDFLYNGGGMNSYGAKLHEYTKSGVKDIPQGTNVIIHAADGTPVASQENFSKGELNGKSPVLLWKTGDGAIDYKMNVPVTGFYEINLAYAALPGDDSRGTIIRSLYFDGKLPFDESRLLYVKRLWKDAAYPPAQDDFGNQIRPKQEQIYEWADWTVADYQQQYAEPFRFYLTQGEHTLRLEGVAEGMALDRIVLHAPQLLPSYEDAHKQIGPSSTQAKNFQLTLEAEQTYRKSDPTVQMQGSFETGVHPEAKGKVIYNLLGGSRWNRGGMWAEWQFEVPEEGDYQITLATIQNLARNVSTFRTVSIDGKVPYRELLRYPFSYSGLEAVALTGSDQKPMLFRLAKGKHTLRLTADWSLNKPAADKISSVIEDLRSLDAKVKMVTGVSIDKTVDKGMSWHLEESMPNVKDELQKSIENLKTVSAYLQTVHGSKMKSTFSFDSSIQDLKKFMEDPDTMPNKPQTLGLLQDQLSTILQNLSSQPLLLDQIIIASPDTMAPKIKPTMWQSVKGFVGKFVMTFTSNFAAQGRKDKDTLNIWVQRGRDYANLLQEMADQEFTPQTGIKVNVSVMPNPQVLILGKAAGLQPDVALGIAEGTPVDFAMRNALVNLNQFPDYREISKRFVPGELIPYHYDGGDWALPENQNFNLLFYRKDILNKLHLSVPQTWDDVYKMLPDLQQNQMNFYVTPEDLLPLLYQRGGEYYAEGGLRSGLNSPEAFQAFKQLTDFFVLYGFDRSANFFQHFRSGLKPIGIGDLNTYIQLTVAAPELTGIWGVAPIPGMVKGNGIERWAGGAQQAGVIFKSSQKQQDAWAFMKWWTSDDVQTNYGIDLESFNGPEYRWNTSNMKALAKQNWPTQDKPMIMEQLRWFKGIPNVPGGYFTARDLNFAWNKAVVNGVNYREALEEEVKDIDKELYRKQQEFGFIDSEGNPVRKLDVPDLRTPWEGLNLERGNSK